MLNKIFEFMSPMGGKARLQVLIFHRVLKQRDPLFPNEIDAVNFDAICSWLKLWGRVLPLNEAVERLKTGTLPAGAMCITFDDGYADNYEVALPILRRHGLSATFYVSTGFLDGGRMWNDSVIEALRGCRLPFLDLRGTVAGELGILQLSDNTVRREEIDRVLRSIKYLDQLERMDWVAAITELAECTLPDDLMMTSAQLVALRDSGMTIGAHTITHPILATLSRKQAVAEIAGSKHMLEALLKERVGMFAYPNGKFGIDYSVESIEIVRELGFDSAVSTAWGASRLGSDIFQLPRFTPWDRTQGRFAFRLIKNLLS